MKTVISIFAIIIAAFTLPCAETLFAQPQAPEAGVDTRTERQKQLARIYELPDSKLTLDEQIYKYGLAIWMNSNLYVEDGAIRTRLTAKDFTDRGYDVYYYEVFTEGNDMFNSDLARRIPSVEERNRKLNDEIMAHIPQQLKEFREKLAGLEKQAAARRR